MTAFYNEIDPFKAEVLREAIKAGVIAPGDVMESDQSLLGHSAFCRSTHGRLGTIYVE